MEHRELPGGYLWCPRAVPARPGEGPDKTGYQQNL